MAEEEKRESLADMIANGFAKYKEDRCHGFWDWFCSDKALAGKSRKLCGNARAITKLTKKFDPKKVYVWFKNNCPCSGSLYDDLRIADLETHDVLYTIVPHDGRTGLSEVWGSENDFSKPLVEGTWEDVKQFFAS